MDPYLPAELVQNPRPGEFSQEWTIRFNTGWYPWVATSEQGRLAQIVNRALVRHEKKENASRRRRKGRGDE